MKMSNRNSRSLFTLLLLPIVILLLVGSLMLFSFFRKETFGDIEEEKRSLEFHVLQTYFREYQRVFILIQSVQQITASSEEELKQNMQSLQDLYGPEGHLPGLIRGISYRKRDDREILYTLNPEYNWVQVHTTQAETAHSNTRELIPGDTMLFSIKDEASGTDRILLRYFPTDQETYQVQVELDWESLEERYVKPAVIQSLSGYILKWVVDKDVHQKYDYFDKPEAETDGRPRPNNFRFSPLKALLGRAYKESEDCVIFLPSPLQTRKPLIFNKSQIPEDESAGLPREIFSRIDRELLRDSGQLLLIGMESAPYYRDIERDNALGWLQSMIFLYGIGGIFLIIVAQLTRLRNLREKEKEFVASMTHELRTPLTVIQSAADNLALGIIPPERINRYGTVIRDQVLRLGTMIEEILLFSSIEGKSGRFEPVRVDLPGLIEEVRNSMDPLAERKGIALKWQTEGLTHTCLSDPDILRLNLNNLVMNALNHAYPDDPGPIRVKIRTAVPDALQITVEDEGRGISPGEQKKVFSPFYRDRYSRQNQEKGSGLGLFISAKKASAAGGSLKLESPYKRIDGKKQRGCRFIFRLPCKRMDIDAAHTDN